MNPGQIHGLSFVQQDHYLNPTAQFYGGGQFYPVPQFHLPFHAMTEHCSQTYLPFIEPSIAEPEPAALQSQQADAHLQEPVLPLTLKTLKGRPLVEERVLRSKPENTLDRAGAAKYNPTIDLSAGRILSGEKNAHSACISGKPKGRPAGSNKDTKWGQKKVMVPADLLKPGEKPYITTNYKLRDMKERAKNKLAIERGGVSKSEAWRRKIVEVPENLLYLGEASGHKVSNKELANRRKNYNNFSLRVFKNSMEAAMTPDYNLSQAHSQQPQFLQACSVQSVHYQTAETLHQFDSLMGQLPANFEQPYMPQTAGLHIPGEVIPQGFETFNFDNTDFNTANFTDIGPDLSQIKFDIPPVVNLPQKQATQQDVARRHLLSLSSGYIPYFQQTQNTYSYKSAVFNIVNVLPETS